MNGRHKNAPMHEVVNEDTEAEARIRPLLSGLFARKNDTPQRIPMPDKMKKGRHAIKIEAEIYPEDAPIYILSVSVKPEIIKTKAVINIKTAPVILSAADAAGKLRENFCFAF